MPEARGVPVVLTLAGFDPSSGAGITADLKTIAAHGCFGTACITALTVQSTRGVSQVQPLPPELVSATLEELWADLPPAAVRIGMLGSPFVGRVIAGFLREKKPKNVVLDPILASSSGADLAGSGTLEVLRRELLPLATVVTPNLPEALALTGSSQSSLGRSEIRAMAVQLRDLGAANVVITGGHNPNNSDFLLTQDGQELHFPGPRIDSTSTHGTGCAFATSIACSLALGRDLPQAVAAAKNYVVKAIKAAPGLGGGRGPLELLWPLLRNSER